MAEAAAPKAAVGVPAPGESLAAGGPVVRVGWAGFARTLFEFQRDPLTCLRRLRRSYGPTLAFRRPSRGGGARAIVITSDPRLARQALGDPGFRSSGLSLPGPRGSAQRRIREGLFRMQGARHLELRRRIGASLARAALGDSHARVERTVAEAIGRWRPGEERDLAREMKVLARHIAVRNLFGLRDLGESDRIGSLLEQWFRLNFGLATRALPLDLPGLRYRRLLETAERLELRIGGLIRERQREGSRGGDVLSELVRFAEERGEDPSSLVGQVNILFLAAHETTAHALTWTFFLLSQHPAVAERLHAELAGTSPEAEPSELQRLPLLGRVIRESMRLLTVVPFSSRVAVAPVEVAGMELEAGSRVVVCHDVMHHLPEHFPRPERFEPGRWTRGEPPPWVYLPFGAGLHRCVGQSFALLTLRSVLAAVLRRYRPAVVSGSRVDRVVNVTLAPRRGLPVRLEPAAARPYTAPCIRGSVLQLIET